MTLNILNKEDAMLIGVDSVCYNKNDKFMETKFLNSRDYETVSKADQ